MIFARTYEPEVNFEEILIIDELTVLLQLGRAGKSPILLDLLIRLESFVPSNST